jgi:MFS family permease
LAGSTIGSIVALAGGGYLLTTLGAGINSGLFGADFASWRVLFLLASLPGILLGILILFRNGSAPGWQPDEQPASFGAALRHLRQHAAGYGWITAATACSLTLTQAVVAWMPMLYVRQYHLATGDAALKLGVMLMVAAPAGQLAGGFALDRMRRSSLVAANNLLLTVCCLACIIPAWIFCTSNTLGISELFYVLFSFLAFAATPAGMTGWQSLAPASLRALIVAILLAIVTLIGVGLGPLMVGVLTDHLFGDAHGLGYALFTLISVSGICGAAAAWTGREAFDRAARLSTALS